MGGGGGEGTGGLAIGTPVYNTNGCEIDPQHCRCFFTSHHPPVHPAVKWVPSLYKARVDKNTDCNQWWHRWDFGCPHH